MRISIVKFLAMPAKQKKQVAPKKSLRLPTRGGSAAAAVWVYKLFFYFFFIYDLAHWPTSVPIVTLDGATDFLATI